MSSQEVAEKADIHIMYYSSKRGHIYSCTMSESCENLTCVFCKKNILIGMKGVSAISFRY